MDIEKRIKDAHDFLLIEKAKQKISYSTLGKYINYSDVGVSKALKKHTLSINQLKILSKKIGVTNPYITDDYVDNKQNEISNEELKKWGDIIANNWEEALKSSDLFKVTFERESALWSLKKLTENK